MAVPVLITELSTTAASNSPAGGDSAATADDFLRVHAAFIAQLYAGASNGQIAFPATQNASTGVNVLDDYEEGTWTPTDGSGANLTFQSGTGRYTKVGRLVHVQCELQYPNPIVSTAAAVISGLPFTSSGYRAALAKGYGNAGTGKATSFEIPAGGTSVRIKNETGGETENIDLANATLVLSGTYEAAA